MFQEVLTILTSAFIGFGIGSLIYKNPKNYSEEIAITEYHSRDLWLD